MVRSFTWRGDASVVSPQSTSRLPSRGTCVPDLVSDLVGLKIVHLTNQFLAGLDVLLHLIGQFRLVDDDQGCLGRIEQVGKCLQVGPRYAGLNMPHERANCRATDTSGRERRL